MIVSCVMLSIRYGVRLVSAFLDHFDTGGHLAGLQKASSGRFILFVVASKYSEVGIYRFYLNFVDLGEGVSKGAGVWGHKSVNGFENVSRFHLI
jgi:hypothetical protein